MKLFILAMLLVSSGQTADHCIVSLCNVSSSSFVNEIIHFLFLLFSLFINILNYLVHYMDMKVIGLVHWKINLHNKLMLCFQENQSISMLL